MVLSAIKSAFPKVSFASPSQVLNRNTRTLAISAVALIALANLPQASAGPVIGFLAGLGTAVTGGAMIGAGVLLAPTGFGVGLVAAGGVVLGNAPTVGIAVGLSPTL